MECGVVLCLCSLIIDIAMANHSKSQNSQELAVLWDYKLKYDYLVFSRVVSFMISTTEDNGGADC